MPQFDKRHIKELQEFLYYGYAHDAKLESVKYEREGNILRVKAYNPIFNVEIVLTFHDVGIVFAINCNKSGSRDTIISLSVEEDFSYLRNYIHQNCDSSEDSLYLLFQLFSGDELHVVSREVIVEIVR